MCGATSSQWKPFYNAGEKPIAIKTKCEDQRVRSLTARKGGLMTIACIDSPLDFSSYCWGIVSEFSALRPPVKHSELNTENGQSQNYNRENVVVNKTYVKWMMKQYAKRKMDRVSFFNVQPPLCSDVRLYSSDHAVFFAFWFSVVIAWIKHHQCILHI